jgi:hypothetical protein
MYTFYVLTNDVTNQSSSRLLTKNLLDSHVLLSVNVAYLIIANVNKNRRKKRFLRVNNYLKTQNFGIIDDLKFY